MSWEQEWIEDLKYLEENHQKEIDDYEKYFNKETFDKIVNKLKENKNYLIKFDDFYGEDKKFLKEEAIDYIEGDCLDDGDYARHDSEKLANMIIDYYIKTRRVKTYEK